MIKDKEWLIKRLENYVPAYERTVGGILDSVLAIAKQLDEPEMLSQEWIEKHKEYVRMDPHGWDTEQYAVVVGDLQNLLVPKQPFGNSEELPTVPQFVADWLEAYRDGWELYISIEEAINYERFDGRTKESDAQSEEMQHWLLNADNQELYARAWLDGFTVEEEQKYRVSSKMADTGGFWFLSKNNDGNIEIGTNEDYFEYGWDATKLTEQKIKDYDERYMAFAVPVEEIDG